MRFLVIWFDSRAIAPKGLRTEKVFIHALRRSSSGLKIANGVREMSGLCAVNLLGRLLKGFNHLFTRDSLISIFIIRTKGIDIKIKFLLENQPEERRPMYQVPFP